MIAQPYQSLLTHPDISFAEQAREGYYPVHNVATLEVLAWVKKYSVADVEAAILRSQQAQQHWKTATTLQKADVLWAWYHAVMQHKEALAWILTSEQGKPLAEAKGEIAYAASFIRWFAEQARRIDGDIITSDQQQQKMFVIQQPVGVTAAITPWNFPTAMITRKAAPAIAAGCSMIVKPAEQTPLSAYALEVLALQAGLPKDVLINLTGDAVAVGESLCQSDVIRKLSFTGSTGIGKILMRQCADNIKKLSLELGGNAPLIVFDDADLDQAVKGVMISKFRNSGQTCVCANRIYVHANIYDQFSQKLKYAVEQLQVGNGLDEGVTQGPLIDQRAVTKVQSHIEDALAKGATLLTGGQPSELGKTFFTPTVLLHVDSSMRVAKEETFGPLAPIFKFEDEASVIQMANDTEYGLAAYLYSSNSSRQWRVSEALEYGMVGINTGLISNERAPFGGIKQSGLNSDFIREGQKLKIKK